MLILDTDHLTAIDRGDAGLRTRLATSPEPIATTIISVGEQLRGLLALIAGARSDAAVESSYARLERWLADAGRLRVLSWDAAAAAVFRRLRTQRLRMGTMDLRIASIAVAAGATLLSRNQRDFAQVPGLALDNWGD